MRKSSVLLSMIVVLAMLLSACGGEETTTSIPSTNVPPVTMEVTATEAPSGTETPAGNETTTPGVPVTGEDNPSRVTNMMDFIVVNQSGEQVGEVDDLVLDFDNTRISYVVVGTGGLADLGEKTVLVPWDSLQLQAGTSGQQNAFVLLADPEFLKNAPDTDINSVLPGMGQPATDWDADVRNFWSTGQVPGGTGTGTGTQTTDTPAAGGSTTTVPESTATSSGTTGGSTTTGTATSTPAGAVGSGTGSQGSGAQLQGVMLASEVLGSTITIGNGQGQGTGTGSTTTGTATPTSSGTGSTTTTSTATSTSGTGSTTTGTATSTSAGTGSTTTGTATSTSSGAGTGTGTGTGTMTGTTATIEDIIVDTVTGDIQYLVLNTPFSDGERWIPVPLSLLRWDATTNGFLFVADANAFQNAPFFQSDQFPDTSAEGWDSEFSTFWQSNGGTGGTSTGGGVTASTATPTP